MEVLSIMIVMMMMMIDTNGYDNDADDVMIIMMIDDDNVDTNNDPCWNPGCWENGDAVLVQVEQQSWKGADDVAEKLPIKTKMII